MDCRDKSGNDEAERLPSTTFGVKGILKIICCFAADRCRLSQHAWALG